MRKFSSIILLCFLFSGCMSSREHITVDSYGAGVLEAEMKMPTGTVTMVDMMMGAMAQAFSSAFTPEGEEPKMPEQKSFSDEVFSKEDLLEKAERSGIPVEIVSYERGKNDDGVYARYTIKFPDVKTFMQSEVVNAKLKVDRDEKGNWFAETVPDERKVDESKETKEKVANFQNSDEFKNLDPATQTMIMRALSDMRFEFLISFPHMIKEVSGSFEKANDTTARLAIGGNILEDPAMFEKVYGMAAQKQKVVWDMGTFAAIKAVPVQSLRGSSGGSAKMEDAGSLKELPKDDPDMEASDSSKGSPVLAEFYTDPPQEAVEDSLQRGISGPPAGRGPGMDAMGTRIEGSRPLEDVKLLIHPDKPAEGMTRLHLKNGIIIEGELIEQTPEYVRVEYKGMPVTFFRDELKKVE